MWQIICRKDGHTCAGLEWPAGTRQLDRDALSPEQVAALRADRWIILEEVADPAQEVSPQEIQPAEPGPRKPGKKAADTEGA
jgi:hypothetical protein